MLNIINENYIKLSKVSIRIVYDEHNDSIECKLQEIIHDFCILSLGHNHVIQYKSPSFHDFLFWAYLA